MHSIAVRITSLGIYRRFLAPRIYKFSVLWRKFWLDPNGAICRMAYQFAHFPTTLYYWILTAMFLPLSLAKLFDLDYEGTWTYDLTLSMSNPYMAGFNEVIVFVYAIALGLASWFAYKRLSNQRTVKRLTTALSWSGFMITVTVFAIVGLDIKILDILIPTPPWNWVALTFSLAGIGANFAMWKWLAREARTKCALSYCLEEFAI